MVKSEYGRWLDKIGYKSGKLYPNEFRFYEKASKAQLEWSEVKNIILHDVKYLLWQRTDVEKYW
jgi:hypothetical protein